MPTVLFVDDDAAMLDGRHREPCTALWAASGEQALELLARQASAGSVVRALNDGHAFRILLEPCAGGEDHQREVAEAPFDHASAEALEAATAALDVESGRARRVLGGAPDQ